MAGLPAPGKQALRGELLVADRVAEAVAALKADPRVEEVSELDSLIRVTVKADDGNDLSTAAEILVQRGFRLRMLREVGGGLEDAFMRLTSTEIGAAPPVPPPIPKNA